MNPKTDSTRWEVSGMKSVSELLDFPFPIHKAFVTAVRSGDFFLGIEFAAARELVSLTKSPTPKSSLEFGPFLISSMESKECARYGRQHGPKTATLGSNEERSESDDT